MIALTESDRNLLGLVLPPVEDLLRRMQADGVEDLVESFRLLLDLDMSSPPPIPLAKYLVTVRLLRATFRYGGNDLAVEVAMLRAADLVASLL